MRVCQNGLCKEQEAFQSIDGDKDAALSEDFTFCEVESAGWQWRVGFILGATGVLASAGLQQDFAVAGAAQVYSGKRSSCQSIASFELTMSEPHRKGLQRYHEPGDIHELTFSV